ncbi:MAG: hypothetical protein U9N44_02730, partial [Chloroflexota bacterium]|nr:hypothetical protein [Chloroflexota bacterium]
AMASQPFVASITLLVIVFLIFVDINKMHLLWFYPLVSIIFELTIGTMAVKKLESFRQDTFQDL